MPTWFQADIKYTAEDEKGQVVNITNSYLFDATSYTEAEAKSYDYLASEVPDFQVAKITKQKINELFIIEHDFDTWFRCKVLYIVFDEKTQKEKRVPFVFVLNASTVKDAYIQLESRLGSVQDYIITDISATKILEVIPHEN